MTPQSSLRRLSASWPVFGLLLGGALVVKGLLGHFPESPPLQAALTTTSATTATFTPVEHAYRPIETIRVGQRVITDLPDGILDIDGQPFDRSLADGETRVEPATWRLIRMRAETVWEDGTIDDTNIETLQPLEWIAANNIHVGGEAPIPLDLVEMGLPEDLNARILAIESCPTIEPGPGNVVLTTVNHLNTAVVELTVQDGSSEPVTMRPTAFHKFYSIGHMEWLSAERLEVGDTLDGQHSLITVLGKTPVPGVHRVYNFTVEGEHLYRVSIYGVLVHNNNCFNAPTGARFTNTKEGLKEVIKNLRDHHGVDPTDAGDAIHKIKDLAGLAPDTNAIVDWTGNVYHPATGDWIGTLTKRF